ncbi:MAG: DUF305 domain-containing protein [Microthrixaceae bacterium]|nr:DUF305 domain-containing protein [Microthrixaceae bacterium]
MTRTDEHVPTEGRDWQDTEGESTEHDSDGDGSGRRKYWRFAAMIATSATVMLVLMYLNTYAWDHVRWSETRFYMAILMGASMALIMLGFMLGMYRNTKLNIAIAVGAVAVFAGSLFLVRSQTTVQDNSYMRAMIPHHSIAILTSENSEISDLRVCDLAVGIIEAQRREIDGWTGWSRTSKRTALRRQSRRPRPARSPISRARASAPAKASSAASDLALRRSSFEC